MKISWTLTWYKKEELKKIKCGINLISCDNDYKKLMNIYKVIIAVITPVHS